MYLSILVFHELKSKTINSCGQIFGFVVSPSKSPKFTLLWKFIYINGLICYQTLFYWLIKFLEKFVSIFTKKRFDPMEYLISEKWTNARILKMKKAPQFHENNQKYVYCLFFNSQGLNYSHYSQGLNTVVSRAEVWIYLAKT